MNTSTFIPVTAELKFDLTKEIGQEGRNSKVWLTYDKQLDQEIVIKQVAKNTFSDPLSYYGEVRKLALSEHPNVVQVKYACEDADNIYFSMPYYQKGSVSKLMNSRFLTAREIVIFSIQFLSGLHNIHTKDLIHFDIKPDNLMISDGGEALLSDFGLAQATSSSGFADQPLGYFTHFPPEAFLQTSHTLQYDVYQSGLTMYRMCNGSMAFHRQLSVFATHDELRDAVLKGAFPNRKFFLPHIPRKLRTVVKKMLSVDVNDRYDSVLHVLNDLSNIDEDLDWQFIPQSSMDTWTRETQSQIYTIRVELHGNNTFDIRTFKTNKSTGKESNVKNHCSTNVPIGAYRKTIEDALKELG